MRIRHLGLMAILSAFFASSSAQADFEVCNKTGHELGLAIAHSNGLEWISEGWWNVPAGACSVILKGTLRARYYYLHAVHYDIGGGWKGDRYFCTTPKSFTIAGRDNCGERGYERTGFIEVDTGDATDYRHSLTDPAAPAQIP